MFTVFGTGTNLFDGNFNVASHEWAELSRLKIERSEGSLGLPETEAAWLEAMTVRGLNKQAETHRRLAGEARQYRLNNDFVFEAADECRVAWAEAYLEQRPETEAVLTCLIKVMASIAPQGSRKSGEEVWIRSDDLMLRLMSLDFKLKHHGLAGGASDWYLSRKTFQTEEHWCSPAYQLALIKMIKGGSLECRRIREGDEAFEIKVDNKLYNEAVLELEQHKDDDWIDQAMVVAERAGEDDFNTLDMGGMCGQDFLKYLMTVLRS